MNRTILPFLAAFFLLTFAATAQNIGSLSMNLSTPAGQQNSIAELGKGKITVVSFWATWCKPCKEEMRSIFPLIQKLNGKVAYVAVSIDNTKTMAKVGPYVSSKGYDFNVLLDPNQELFKAANGSDVPYTLIFNADGTLHSKHDGFLEGDEVKLEKELTDLLAATTGAK